MLCPFLMMNGEFLTDTDESQIEVRRILQKYTCPSLRLEIPCPFLATLDDKKGDDKYRCTYGSVTITFQQAQPTSNILPGMFDPRLP